MGALAAHRERGPVDVADGDLQDGFFHAVVNGDIHADGLDGDISDDAGAGEVQQGVVFRQVLIRHGIGVRLLEQSFVVFMRGLDHLVQFFLIHALNGVGVGGDGAGGVERVPPVAHRRISHDPQADQHDQNEEPCSQSRSLFSSFFLCGQRSFSLTHQALRYMVTLSNLVYHIFFQFSRRSLRFFLGFLLIFQVSLPLIRGSDSFYHTGNQEKRQ